MRQRSRMSGVVEVRATLEGQQRARLRLRPLLTVDRCLSNAAGPRRKGGSGVACSFNDEQHFRPVCSHLVFGHEVKYFKYGLREICVARLTALVRPHAILPHAASSATSRGRLKTRAVQSERSLGGVSWPQRMSPASTRQRLLWYVWTLFQPQRGSSVHFV